MNMEEGEKRSERKGREAFSRWSCLRAGERQRAALFLNSEWQAAETWPNSETATAPDP